ncbi:MAG: glycosyltransferase [Prevotella sp.]|jgi:glycosyltransferase involved in cell wall biosynthesis|nr:glycosyltransferase [Prevotella sp.]
MEIKKASLFTDKKYPCVSIVIPIYNAELYLNKCLDSVINQTYQNTQIICINDGSTDNSLSIIKKYEMNDKRIAVIDQMNAGVDVSRNSAFQHIKGKYILFVDADDWIELNACERLVEKAENSGAEIVMFYASSKEAWIDSCQKEIKYNEEKIVIDKQSALELFAVWNKLWLSSFIFDNRIYFADGIGADAVVSWKGIVLAKKIAIVPEKLYNYRIVSTSVSNSPGMLHLFHQINFNKIYNFLCEEDCYSEYHDFYLSKKMEVFLRSYPYINDSNKIEYTNSFMKGLTYDMKEFYLASISTPDWLKKYLHNRKAKQQRKDLYLEIQLVDHCNLQCKSCSHFSPIAEEYYLDIADFENDCKRLADLGSEYIKTVRLMGGEPLLHPSIVQILRLSRIYFNTARIELVTNGILLTTQSETFWEVCAENKIKINISYYPIKLDINLVIDLSKKYKVDLYYFIHTNRKMWKMRLDLSGSQDIYKSFIKCDQANNCINLSDGKIYTCPTIPYVKHLNRYFNEHLPVTENDYIDIYRAESMNQILIFLSQAVPFCKYCNQDNIENFDWTISNKRISEWVE